YQFVSQGLSHALQHGAGAKLEVHATGSETLEIELCYEVQRAKQGTRLAHDVDLAHENLRQRIEALGGSLRVHSEADRHLRISARLPAAATVTKRAYPFAAPAEEPETTIAPHPAVGEPLLNHLLWSLASSSSPR